MLTKVLPTIQEEFKSRGNGFKQGESLSASERENEDENGGISIVSVVTVHCWLVGLRCVNTFEYVCRYLYSCCTWLNYSIIILYEIYNNIIILYIKKKCPRYIVSYFWINTCTHQSYEKMSKKLESILNCWIYQIFSSIKCREKKSNLKKKKNLVLKFDCIYT